MLGGFRASEETEVAIAVDNCGRERPRTKRIKGEGETTKAEKTNEGARGRMKYEGMKGKEK